jgi:hypothetical protein
MKFMEADVDKIQEVMKANVGQAKSYDDWRKALSPVIEQILSALVPTERSPYVLHVDDVQTMMGNVFARVVDWDEKVDPWNFVMPTLCGWLQSLMVASPDARCVLSGTNFFAPLVVNTGSVAETSFLSIDGTFPPDWVMKNLVQKYFQIPPARLDQVRNHVTFLSGNRRAVQHYMVDLKLLLRYKREGDDLSTKELEKVRDSAFKKWSDPVLHALGRKSEGAITAVALITFPEVFGGEKKQGTISFEGDGFSVEVKKVWIGWRPQFECFFACYRCADSSRMCVGIVVLCCK